ncbi:hypothetical protein [Halolamina rubra]|uniref:hypothetical protein n=1 Tax=Halolamina rubra TaxID=1380430 RepID=UPI0012AC05B9|nr:hypothetical protein [Halolamina rubra]
MTRLYIVPIGKNWIDNFQNTVQSKVPVPDVAPDDLQREEEVRIWGTTEGRRKRRFFEEMESGDRLLFYNEGKFFAAGRVGTAFEDEDVGKTLWNNSESRFIYTVSDYQEISVPREEVALLLGYKENWYPQRFLRVSPDAVNSLLQQYNSIEEAFQDFQADNGPDGPEKSDEGKDSPREHTEIQWQLIQLGLAHGYDVYVARNDKNREYEGNRLGEDCIENLNLPGFSPAATRIIEYVDVIWLDDDFIAKMFEVESTTSIYSGILRMTDFMVKVPNIAVDMHIVASTDDEDKVREEISRPTFQHVLEPAEHCSLGYLSFENVRKTHETVQQAGPLQDVF